ncbi:MAG: hypothetical protein P8M49_13580 [Thalassotalea sp.]|nr:hypothetical protein [Thalassotalea sp.]MDG2394541.1 hypothetical protein [Thalassotalea sp.]
MKHFKTTAISLLLALSFSSNLSACGDDNKDSNYLETQVSQKNSNARDVIISFEYLSNGNESSDVASIDDAIISTVVDSQGNEHYIRNDSYVITIIDEAGIKSFTDVIIFEESTYSYSVTGEAEVIVTHQNLDANQDGIIDTDKNGDVVKVESSYFTATGTMILPADAKQANLTVSNQYYSIDNHDIDNQFNVALAIDDYTIIQN